MRSLLVLFALCVIPASAESLFSIGIIGGAPFTDVVSTTSADFLNVTPKSTNFTIGPSFQVNLPLNLRLEVDALYRPYSFTGTSGPPTFPVNPVPTTVSGTEWTFPILAQYRFKTRFVKPFVEIGVSLDHLANLSAVSGSFALLRQTTAGVVLGGGVDVEVPFVRLSGELRYTHEGSPYFQAISNLNQAEVLVGVHF
jgi:hypothetical protein